MARPALKRQAVDYVVSHYGIARRRACRIVQQHRSVQYYHSRRDPQVALRSRMRELAATRVRYGYRRLHILLRREGWHLGKDKAYRLYSEEQLQLRSKLPRRPKMVAVRRDTYRPKRTNQAWCMDFVADQLADGTRLNWFRSIDEAKETVEAWRRDYNESRPHMALDGMTPREFSLRNGILPRTEIEITAGN